MNRLESSTNEVDERYCSGCRAGPSVSSPNAEEDARAAREPPPARRSFRACSRWCGNVGIIDGELAAHTQTESSSSDAILSVRCIYAK